MAVSLDQFAQRVVESSLMSADAVAAAVVCVRAVAHPQSGEQLADVRHRVFDESHGLLLRQRGDGAILLVAQARMDESSNVR